MCTTEKTADENTAEQNKILRRSIPFLIKGKDGPSHVLKKAHS